MRNSLWLACLLLAAVPVAAQSLDSDVNTVTADLQRAAGHDFYVYHNDIFPGFLLHSKRPSMYFFRDLDKVGLSGPTHMAWSEGGQVKVAKAPAKTGARLDAPWVIVWFEGGQGWGDTKFIRHSFNKSPSFKPEVGPIDVPWLVILQKQAVATLDAAGLAIESREPLGHVVFMPLAGSLKLKPEMTGQWADGLPKDIVDRAALWTTISRKFPLYVKEDYQVDEQADAVRIRNSFQYLTIADAWNTQPLTVAPLSPVMALALTSKYHMTVEPAPVNLNQETHWGPYYAALNAESHVSTITGVLKYIDEIETVKSFKTDTPGFEDARRLLLRRMGTAAAGEANPRRAYSIDWGMGMLGAWMRAMKHIPEDLQTRVIGYIRSENLLNGYFLNPEVYQEVKVSISPRRELNILAVKPRQGLQTYAGDLVKQTSRMPYVVWQYGHYSDDWSTVRARYDMVKQMYGFNILLGWSNVGPEYTAEHAKISALQGPIGLARLGKQFNEQATYDYGAYLLAKAMVNQWAWTMAAVPYANKNAPWMHPTDGEWIMHENHGYVGLQGLPLDQTKTYDEIPLVLDRFNREELAEWNDYYIRMRHKFFPNEIFNNVYVTDLGDAENLEALYRKPLTDLLKPEVLRTHSHLTPGFYNYPVDLMELASESAYERLYPKGSAQPVWRDGLDSLSAGQSWRQMAIAIRSGTGPRNRTWPFPCWYLMNPPKRDRGFPNDVLPFGYIRPDLRTEAKGTQLNVRSNWNSEILAWDLD